MLLGFGSIAMRLRERRKGTLSYEAVGRRSKAVAGTVTANKVELAASPRELAAVALKSPSQARVVSAGGHHADGPFEMEL